MSDFSEYFLTIAKIKIKERDSSEMKSLTLWTRLCQKSDW